MSTTREALEAALAANPDDVAAHAAYADLLIEAGDPRGEYIRLQLALEDRNQPADRLRAMEQEAFALRREHEAEWLGPLAEFVLPKRGPSVGAMVADNVEVTWRRGWIQGVRIGRPTVEILQALADFRPATLLQELTVRTGFVTGDLHLAEVCDADFVPGLRALTIGDAETWRYVRLGSSSANITMRAKALERIHISAGWLTPGRWFIANLPCLQELSITTNNQEMPLGIMGQNRSLLKLTRLHLDLVQFQPDPDALVGGAPYDSDALREFFRSPYLPSLHYLGLRLPGFGDAGVDELISSGMIARLKGLDLCRCEITDDGAQELAACPDVAKLEYLHLDNNLLSPVGIEALAAVGVTVSDRQMYGGWEEEV